MKVNTTSWNRIRYSFYAPFYDIAEVLLGKGRRQAIRQISPQTGEKILLLGCGTGLDLEHLPHGVSVTAVDISPAMVTRTRERAKKLNLDIEVSVNGEKLDFSENTFDCVFLHLILAVIPDPVACIREAKRVCKKTGRISIFDKFVPPGQSPSLFRRSVNLVTNLFFSDITRQLEVLIQAADLRIVEDHPVMWGNNFRTVTVLPD